MIGQRGRSSGGAGPPLFTPVTPWCFPASRAELGSCDSDLTLCGSSQTMFAGPSSSQLGGCLAVSPASLAAGGRRSGEWVTRGPKAGVGEG